MAIGLTFRNQRLGIELELPDGIYNVFAIDDGKITRIDDFGERADAYAAVELAGG